MSRVWPCYCLIMTEACCCLLDSGAPGWARRTAGCTQRGVQPAVPYAAYSGLYLKQPALTNPAYSRLCPKQPAVPNPAYSGLYPAYSRLCPTRRTAGCTRRTAGCALRGVQPAVPGVHVCVCARARVLHKPRHAAYPGTRSARKACESSHA
jgi:hypothetical protein